MFESLLVQIIAQKKQVVGISGHLMVVFAEYEYGAAFRKYSGNTPECKQTLVMIKIHPTQ